MGSGRRRPLRPGSPTSHGKVSVGARACQEVVDEVDDVPLIGVLATASGAALARRPLERASAEVLAREPGALSVITVGAWSTTRISARADSLRRPRARASGAWIRRRRRRYSGVVVCLGRELDPRSEWSATRRPTGVSPLAAPDAWVEPLCDRSAAFAYSGSETHGLRRRP